MTTLRTFIAIELPASLHARLEEIQDQLEAETPARLVRWVRPEGIHLTLKFLGDTPDNRVEAIKAGLARAAATVAPFQFEVKDLGCFPNTRRPNNVWVGVHEPSGALARLQRAVEEAISPLGYPPEGRAFHPHLTLGRTNRNARPLELQQFGELVARTPQPSLGTVQVTGISLVKSDLRPDGAIYTRLAFVPLSGD